MEVDTVFFLWSMFPAAFFPENMDWAISNADTLSSFLSFTSFLLLAFEHSPNVSFKLLILLHLKYLILKKNGQSCLRKKQQFGSWYRFGWRIGISFGLMSWRQNISCSWNVNLSSGLTVQLCIFLLVLYKQFKLIHRRFSCFSYWY